MADRLVTPGSDISRDTHVGTSVPRVADGVTASPSKRRPEALVAGNRVSTGQELEVDG